MKVARLRTNAALKLERQAATDAESSGTLTEPRFDLRDVDEPMAPEDLGEVDHLLSADDLDSALADEPVTAVLISSLDAETPETPEAAGIVRQEPLAEVAEADHDLAIAEEPRQNPSSQPASSNSTFSGTADERRAIELHSVGLAVRHLEALGWTVQDVGATQSYDLLATRGQERLHVEVKGTTTLGNRVILTRAEVEAQRGFAPHNALVVVHSIRLDYAVGQPRAEGGVLVCISPWYVADDDLAVISYSYETGL